MSKLIPAHLESISPPPRIVIHRGYAEMVCQIDMAFDPTGKNLPELRATKDAPSLYPHAPKRVQSVEPA